MSGEMRKLTVIFTTRGLDRSGVDDDDVEAVVASAVAAALEQTYNDADHLFACRPEVV